MTIRVGMVTAMGGGEGVDICGGRIGVTVSISGGLFAREPKEGWLEIGYAVVANEDKVTKTAYPWAVVMDMRYPQVWPAADEAVMARFGDWRSGKGANADLSTDDAQKAFLLNVGVEGIKELKIESIEVDAEGYATIVVSAPGRSSSTASISARSTASSLSWQVGRWRR